jgi:uncharacterized protein (UPF0261 family)/ABC-type branched-subunit amino acid transport system ATPase component
MEPDPILVIQDLQVSRGASPILQGVSLTVGKAPLALVGRNGMGKSTLCDAIMGLLPLRGGSIELCGRPIGGLRPFRVARAGIGYVPQGRRVFSSLSVHEHLRMVASGAGGWTIERVYATFPRLAERRRNGGAELSGGEQQMLAVARALLLNPVLLVMDEPTEGLAPVIVDHLIEVFRRLASEGIAMLLVEQNLAVATAVADRVLIMLNGRIAIETEARDLATNADLQRRYLGAGTMAGAAARGSQPMANKRIYVVGTADTKGAELAYVRTLIHDRGIAAAVIDVSTYAHGSGADIEAGEVASYHPDGPQAVFTGDRGRSITAMAVALERFLTSRQDIGGVIGLGGSGGTALIAPAMRALSIGVPKLLVSTVASSNVAPYVGGSDIAMMYSVTDLAGLNRISRLVLANAAHAMAGMASASPPPLSASEKLAVGITMFSVTTPCVNQLVSLMEDRYDCLVFHATGTGGQSMEKLVDSGLLAAVIDVTTTEVCDLLMGGVFPCTEDRFGAVARTGLPYVGSCGALDMVNFGALSTVPPQYKDRNLYVHNSHVTLMRTTPEENRRIGQWIGERLNLCEGPVRFLLPLGGVSLLDAPGMAFHDPEADMALFDALERTVRQTDLRRLIRVPEAVNDPAFADHLLAQFQDVMESV